MTEQELLLQALLAEWVTLPELRLGQMLMAAAALADRDLFLVPDGELIEMVRRVSTALAPLSLGQLVNVIYQAGMRKGK